MCVCHMYWVPMEVRRRHQILWTRSVWCLGVIWVPGAELESSVATSSPNSRAIPPALKSGFFIPHRRSSFMN